MVVYKLMLTKDNESIPIYVGKTKQPDVRYKQHASRRSACRLVRNAFRAHGRSKISLEVILRCRQGDVDVNEAYWIERLGTLHRPHGCNVMRGCRAGDETNVGTLIESSVNIVPFSDETDEIEAEGEALIDVSRMLRIADDIEAMGVVDETDGTDDAEEIKWIRIDPRAWRRVLRLVHPDLAGTRVFNAFEVNMYLNSTRMEVRSLDDETPGELDSDHAILLSQRSWRATKEQLGCNSRLFSAHEVTSLFNAMRCI